MADLKEVRVAHASFWYEKAGRNAIAVRGDLIEVGPTDYDRGVAHGAFATEPEAAEDADETFDFGRKAEDVLQYVGTDAALAAEALEFENAKGDKARSTLVEKLDAIANPSS